MSYRLWWRWNDGVSGHIWLSAGDVERIGHEMAVQGMAGLADRIARAEPGTDLTVAPQEVAAALEGASPDPITLDDRELWREWLVFLEGAEAKGGLLVRR